MSEQERKIIGPTGALVLCGFGEMRSTGPAGYKLLLHISYGKAEAA